MNLWGENTILKHLKLPFPKSWFDPADTPKSPCSHVADEKYIYFFRIAPDTALHWTLHTDTGHFDMSSMQGFKLYATNIIIRSSSSVYTPTWTKCPVRYRYTGLFSVLAGSNFNDLDLFNFHLVRAEGQSTYTIFF